MAISVIFAISSPNPTLSAISGRSSHFVIVESRSNTNSGLLPVNDFDHVDNLSIPSDHLFIIVLPVRKTAIRAILESLFIVAEAAAAFSSQCVKRAIAEKTVEGLRIRALMTGEVFTFAVLEKRIVLFTHVFRLRSEG